ncbi:MAG: hypothetical protein R3C60_05120 [Parvularculaceae bacterium]
MADGGARTDQSFGDDVRRAERAADGKAAPAPATSFDEPDDSASRRVDYSSVIRSLQDDAEAVEPREAGRVNGVGRRMAGAMLDQHIFSTTRRFFGILLAVFLAAAVVFLIGAVYAASRQVPMGQSVIGFTYALFGLIAVAVMDALAKAAADFAHRRFQNAASDLLSLTEKEIGAMSDGLVEQRAAMEANSAADFPKAVEAATKARLTTVAALRYFKNAPVIGVASEGRGHECRILVGNFQSAAKARLDAAQSATARMAAVALGVIIGAAALYASLEGQKIFAPIPDGLQSFIDAERRSPGIVSFGLVVLAAIIAASWIGRASAILFAAYSPHRVLAGDPLRSMANSLRAEALSGAAERPRELMERYADALISLQKRAQSWAASNARFDDRPTDDEPSWRKAPEGPRFVAPRFDAAPPGFTAEASPGARKHFFSKKVHRNAAPKQSFGREETPRWLKD